MLTSSSKQGHHHGNTNVYELHIQKVTCMQKLKFVLALKPKKFSVFFAKTAKKVEYDGVIFNMITSSSKC